ncbi:unnamed protein product, partial [marine sediment metagenome]
MDLPFQDQALFFLPGEGPFGLPATNDFKEDKD